MTKTTKCIHLLYSVSYKILSLVKNPPQTNLSTYENVRLRWMNEESPVPETDHIKDVVINNVPGNLHCFIHSSYIIALQCIMITFSES